MKFLYAAVALSALQAYTCAAQSSTVTCVGCPTTTAMDVMVTRSPVPTSSCTGASLTVVYNTANMTKVATSTPTPFQGAGSRVMGSLSGAIVVAAAAAAAYVL